MKIVALGGGEIGRAGFSVETLEVDQEILRLTGKKRPKLLFIPTASSDSQGYVEDIRKHFGSTLGCAVDVLYLLNGKTNVKSVETQILGSDIVYVGGGNTLKMMKIWRRKGINEILKRAAGEGIILSGVSAGGICWFQYGSSDSWRFKNPKANLIRVTGLNFIPAIFCPHYNSQKDRNIHIKNLLKRTPGTGIAVDTQCAIEIIDGEYRIIAAKKEANAYKLYWKKGQYFEELIQKEGKMQPLSLILEK